MNTQDKCVMVIDKSLPIGIITNTAAILGITLGKFIPAAIGPDIYDEDGCKHTGIIKLPVPILSASSQSIKILREKLYQPDFCDLTTVDFSDVAQSCKDYSEFAHKMFHSSQEDLQYFGIAIYGPKKKVNKLTGSIPLLR